MRVRWTKQIPNALSWSRVGIAFLFPFVDSGWRLLLIIWALVSEFLDGFLARRLNAESSFGQALDPIADKLFVLSTIGVLVVEEQLSLTNLVLVAMRDIVVAIGTLSVTMESRTRAIHYLKPRKSGKITTALQFVLLILLYLKLPIAYSFLVLTSAVSCMSAIDYLYVVLHRRFDLDSTF